MFSNRPKMSIRCGIFSKARLLNQIFFRFTSHFQMIDLLFSSQRRHLEERGDRGAANVWCS
jgi:hypothetical protein